MSLKLFKPTSDTQVDWFSVILKIIIGIYAIIMLLFLPLGQKSDSFYMIASGEWMLDNRALELYNVAAPVTIPVIGQNWLLCIYYALMWRLGEILSIGYGALYIQHVILMCCSVYVIRRLSKWYVKDSIYIADVMTILFLLCLPYLTAIRFAYVSATFVFLTFVLMQGWIDNRFKHFATPFIIVFFMAIVHMNCSSALSLVIPLAVLFVAIRNMFDKTTRKSSIGLIGFTLVLPICMGLCCPYGFEAVSVVFGANRINESLSGTPFSVNEIRSVFENPVYVVVQYMILGILIIWFFVYVRKLSWPFNLPWFIRLTWFDFCDLSLIIVAEIAVAVAARNVIYLVVFAMWNILQIWTSFEKILAESVDDNQFVSGMVYWFKYRNFVVAYVFFAFTALSLLMLLFDCYFMLLMPTTFDNDNIPIATEQYPLAETSISFIADNTVDISGKNMWCGPNIGSYLSFKGANVALNTRFEVWAAPVGESDSWFADVVKTYWLDKTTPDVGRGEIKNVEWDYACVDVEYAETFENSPSWELVISDNVYALYEYVGD